MKKELLKIKTSVLSSFKSIKMSSRKVRFSLILSGVVILLMLFQNCADSRLSGFSKFRSLTGSDTLPPSWASFVAQQTACSAGWETAGSFSCDANQNEHQQICGCNPPNFSDPNYWVNDGNGCYSHVTGKACGPAPVGQDGVSRKVIGYVDSVNFDSGLITGWACAVGESRPITVLVQSPAVNYTINMPTPKNIKFNGVQFQAVANIKSEAVLNSAQYCNDSGPAHRFTVQMELSKLKQAMDYFGVLIIPFKVYATNDYGQTKSPSTSDYNHPGINSPPGFAAVDYASLIKEPDSNFYYIPGLKNYLMQKSAALDAFESAAKILDPGLRLSALTAWDNKFASSFSSIWESKVVPAMYETLVMGLNKTGTAAVAEICTLTGGSNPTYIIEVLGLNRVTPAGVSAYVGSAGFATTEFLTFALKGLAGGVVGAVVSYGLEQAAGYLYDINATHVQDFIERWENPSCDFSCVFGLGNVGLSGLWGNSFISPTNAGFEITIDVPVFPAVEGMPPKNAPAPLTGSVHLTKQLPPAPPSCTITASPNSGVGDIHLTWSTTNAVSAILGCGHGPHAVAVPSGSEIYDLTPYADGAQNCWLVVTAADSSTYTCQTTYTKVTPPPYGLNYRWIPTTQLVLTQAAAIQACSSLGASLPSVSQFVADHNKAKDAGKTIQSLFNVPSQLHWLNDDVGCAPSGSACFYRPGQEAAGNEAQMYQAFPNDPSGNGNSGNGGYAICIQ